MIQRPHVYNERGDKDTQGRILVPTKDADAIIAGDKEPEPLFFRANAGDCINFNLTNRLPNFIGNDAFIKLAQTNMMGQHIHLVKFDVLGSDGSSNGWNYQGAAFTKDQADFNKEVLADTTGTKCTTNEATGACRLPLPNDYDPNTTSQGLAPGQTIDMSVEMQAPGKGAWLLHCHVLPHIMGPDGTSLNIAMANGGMVIPVVYEDSENLADIVKALQDAIAGIQPDKTGGLRPDAANPLMDAIDQMNSSAMQMNGTATGPLSPQGGGR